MAEALKLAHNAVVAKLFGADKDAKDILTRILSYAVEGAEHTSTFKSTGWDGRASFFNRVECTFPAGFVHMVYAELVKAGRSVHLIRDALPAPLGPANPIVDEFGNHDPDYDYQMRALRQVERHGRGIIQVATGGGKSKIAKLITARFRRMTMFITTRGVLLYQMRDAYVADCNFRVGVIGDGQFSPVKGVNVGMVQTLIAMLAETTPELEARRILERINAAENKELERVKSTRLKAKVGWTEIKKELDAITERQERERPTDKQIAAQATEKAAAQMKSRARIIRLLEMVEVVIGEEAHEAGGNSYYEILRHCRNAQIRVALTATPFMRADAEDNMRLMAAFGSIMIRVTEKQLIDRGILAKPYFKFVTSKPHPKLRKTSPWQRAVQLGYVENPFLLADIVRDAVRARDHGLPVLTLIQRKDHGKAVAEAFEEAGVRAVYLKGEDDQEGRKRALARLKAGEIDAIIGTTILDVGVDVPAIGLVQLAGGGKAEVALRQRIGRGLRRKRGMANVAFVIDYTTESNMHLRDHTRTRRAIIESTPGFVEGILPPGKDLPWELFQDNKLAA